MGFITQGSTNGFNPLTFEDLFAPVKEYMNVYNQVNDEYSNLVDMTEAWRDIANRDKSPEAYSMFRAYADQLDSYASDFARNGLNARNRRGLMGMKSGYASNIAPISRASDALNAANKVRDDAGPDAIFEVSRYDSLDQFLHGETANNKRESRQDIQTRTAAQIQAAVGTMLSRPDIRQSLSPQFLEVVTGQKGNDMNALMQAISNDPTANNIFTQIKSGMMREIGMDRFDADGRRAVEGAINTGLYAGLDQVQTQLMENGEYMNKAQRVQAAQNAANLAFQREQWLDTKEKLEGIRAIETLPDGTKVHLTGTGNTWTSTRQQGTRVVDGETQYKYKDSDGNIRWGQSAGLKSMTTEDGYSISVTPVNDGDYKASAVTQVDVNKGKSSKKDKLGYTHGVSLSLDGSQVFDGSETVVMEDPEYLTPVNRGFDGLGFEGQSYVEMNLPIVNANRDQFNYYWAWIDKNGNITDPYATGKRAPVEKQLIIKDK